MSRRLAAKLANTMRRDPGPAGSVSYGFVDLPAAPPAPAAPALVLELPGRRGASERDLVVERTGDAVTIALAGWFRDTLRLDLRQAAFVRDALTRALAPQDSGGPET